MDHWIPRKPIHIHGNNSKQVDSPNLIVRDGHIFMGIQNNFYQTEMEKLPKAADLRPIRMSHLLVGDLLSSGSQLPVKITFNSKEKDTVPCSKLKVVVTIN
jgi:hypothetical protein